MGTIDSNGIYFYEETDAVSPLHTLLNVGQQSVSDALDDSIRWFVVANNAAKTALATAESPTPTEPLIVRQTDEGTYYENIGSGWVQMGINRPGYVWDSVVSAWLPQSIGGSAVMNISAGTGVNTLPLSRTVVSSQRYSWSLINGDATTQPSLQIMGVLTPVTGSISGINYKYTGGAAGAARINWQAIWVG